MEEIETMRFVIRGSVEETTLSASGKEEILSNAAAKVGDIDIFQEFGRIVSSSVEVENTQGVESYSISMKVSVGPISADRERELEQAFRELSWVEDVEFRESVK